MNKKARVIAMYLPQFHSIPENDKYWGKGFTEWTNVVQAKPLFRGHYQPRIPSDLGFYDLRLPEVREAQAELARNAGIEGFMYWHYWFGNGRMLLERPFQEVLKTGKPDFPFCLGWANHSWTTKTWVKEKHLRQDTMIMEQLYPGKEDYINHFYYVLPAFRDKRYITIDGCPIFVIYDPLAIPDISSFITCWRDLAVKNGLKDIHFIGLRYGRLSNYDLLIKLGFDAINNRSIWEAECAAVGNKWIKILKSQLSRRMGRIILQKYEYKKIIKYLATNDDIKENVYPTLLSGYDRTARAGRQAVIYHGCTPKLFGEHIDKVLDLVKHKKPEYRILFLKSWNEWGEGNYVEPDLKYGHQFLDELRKRVLI